MNNILESGKQHVQQLLLAGGQLEFAAEEDDARAAVAGAGPALVRQHPADAADHVVRLQVLGHKAVGARLDTAEHVDGSAWLVSTTTGRPR